MDFEIINPNKCKFKSYFGKFLSSLENGNIIEDKIKVTNTEIFTIIFLNKGINNFSQEIKCNTNDINIIDRKDKNENNIIQNNEDIKNITNSKIIENEHKQIKLKEDSNINNNFNFSPGKNNQQTNINNISKIQSNLNTQIKQIKDNDFNDIKIMKIQKKNIN